MADVLVLDWLDEFEALTESDLHEFSIVQENNHEIMMAIYEVLSDPQRYKSDNLIDGICQQLLNFYRSGETHLKLFTIQFIPALVFLHLSDKSFSAVQTLLVSLYNLEVIDPKGQPRTLSFRIPSLAVSSIYHDSNSIEPSFMAAETTLRRWEECNTKLVSWGPLPQVECLNAQNRQRVATALIFLYNQHVANVITQGVEQTCRGISRLVTQGFNYSSNSNRSSIASDSSIQQSLLPRIPISSSVLIELLHVTYHGAERCASVALQALHDITQRALHESYAEVLLAAYAIKNLLQHSPTVSATPRPSHTQSVSKSMITNASFRTKKLPDDIPIQDSNQPSTTESALNSITEEQEQDTDKTKSSTTKTAVKTLKHLSRPNISMLSKKKKTKMISGEQTMEMAAGEHNDVGGDGNHTVHVMVWCGTEALKKCIT